MDVNETVHISWVHHGQVDAMFAHSMIDLMKNFPTRIGSHNSILGLGLLAKSRNIAVKHFLDSTKDDWMLMIDGDEYLGSTEFQMLISAADKDDRPVMAALVFSANQSDITAPLRPIPVLYILTIDGVQPYFDYPQNSVVEVYAAGTGCLMVHRSVLEKLRELDSQVLGRDWCWFRDGPIPEENIWLSEDLNFCARLQDLNIPIHAHTGAVIPHHKQAWIVEAHYARWVQEQVVRKN